jgi:hypothetical protein
MMDAIKALDIDRSLERAKAEEDHRIWINSQEKISRVTKELNSAIVAVRKRMPEAISRLSTIENASMSGSIERLPISAEWKNYRISLSTAEREIDQIMILNLPFFLLQTSFFEKMLHDIYNHHDKKRNFAYGQIDLDSKISYTKLVALLSVLSLQLTTKACKIVEKEKLDSLISLEDYFLKIYLNMSVLGSQLNGKISPQDCLCLIRYRL